MLKFTSNESNKSNEISILKILLMQSRYEWATQNRARTLSRASGFTTTACSDTSEKCRALPILIEAKDKYLFTIKLS